MVSKGNASRTPPHPPRIRRPRLASISRATSRVSALSAALGRRSWVRRAPRDADRRSAFNSQPQPISLRFLDSTAQASTNGTSCIPKLCNGCLSCCCCCGCCCCCLNLEYLRSKPGMLRIAQLVLSWLCNWLLGRYAMRVSGTLGSAMPSLFLAAAAGAVCCSLLLVVSVLSARTLALLRASLLELTFHATAVGLYASQASCMHVATNLYLEPYKNDMESYTYPAVVTSYWMGYFLAALHTVDIVYSFKHYRQYRT